MRKIVPYICSVLYALMGALLMHSVLCGASIIISPFSDNSFTFILFLLAGIVIVSALILIALMIFNVRLLFQAKNPRCVVLIEIIASLILLYPFLKIWEIVFDALLF